MDDLRASMLLIASGQIENPGIEMEVEGEMMSFSGREAKVFAVGVLTGLKAVVSDVTLDNSIKLEEGK